MITAASTLPSVKYKITVKKFGLRVKEIDVSMAGKILKNIIS